MTRPQFIPRTLIGVGGVRLFDIPGVTYPEEMLKVQPGVKKEDGKPYDTVPSWGISTKEAARILACTPSSARTAMHKNKVEFRVVCDETTRRIYWRKAQVEKLANKRYPLMQGDTKKLITAYDAMKILGVSRSALQRLADIGRLRVHRVRYCDPEAKGTRRRLFFERAAVLKLSYKLAARRHRAAELEKFH